MSNSQDFEVRQPRWLLILGIAVLVIAAVLIVLAVAEMCVGGFGIDTGITLIAISCLFIFASVLCLYCYRNDIFKYSDGKFLCRRIFYRTRTWELSEISRVELIKQYGEKSPTACIVFWDKNDKILVKVNGIDPILKDSRLKQLLVYYNIPVEVKSTFK